MTAYSSRELMTLIAAREIQNEEIIFCGTGISLIAAMAAKHIYNSNAAILFETGAIDPQLRELPLTVADSRVMYGSCMNTGIAEIFGYLQNRSIHSQIAGILGAAQIDIFGNLNSTCIGDVLKPAIRLPGSGGACDLGSFVSRLIIFMQCEPKRFVKKLDYISTPGYIDGDNSREMAGYSHGGPSCVISDKAIFRFESQSKEMYCDCLYPSISPQEVQNNISFNIDVSHTKLIEIPSQEEFDILRKKIDPQRLII